MQSRNNPVTPDILTALKNGSYDAYTSVYMHYVIPVKSFINSLIRSEENAKEITQNVFMRLWEKRESIMPESDIRIFLFQTARFYAYNYLDRQKVRDKYVDYLANGKNSQHLSTEDIIDYEETSLLIEMALEKMPKQRRAIFEMSRNEGLSNNEIAKRLSLSKRTVETHISLAIKDIKSFLG